MLSYFSRGRGGAAFHFLAGAALLAIFVCTWFVGVVPTRSHPNDIIFCVDVAWRTISGLRPHLDYYSPWGGGVGLLLAAGQLMAGGTANGIGYINACVGLAVGVWAYLLALRRASPPIAVAVAGSLALLCVAPVSLGYLFTNASQAMFYNRYGYALLSLVIIEGFPISSESKPGSTGAFSTGVVCALLFFLKASFFAVAVVLALASLLWNPQARLRRLFILGGGVCAGALPFLIYLGFRVDLIYADLRMAGAARAGAIGAATLMSNFTRDIFALVALLALGFVVGREEDSSSVFRRWRFSLLALGVYGTGVLLLSTNAQPERLPLNELLALLLAGAFLEIAACGAPRIPVPVAVALAVISLALALPNAAGDAAGLANGMRLKRSHNEEYAHNIPIRGLTPWIILDDYIDPAATVNTGAALAPYLTDGVELLRKNFRPGERITTLDMQNPFPYLLGVPPARGGIASASYGILLNDKFHPSADAYFGDADLVMYPKQSSIIEESARGLTSLYGEELKRRYTLAAESSRWWLYRRNP